MANSTTDQIAIYLEKRSRVLLPEGHGNASPVIVATAATNLLSLGFGLRRQLVEQLRSLSDEQVTAWYQSVLPVLQRMTGAHQSFVPMYRGFPEQVMQASEAELFFNAIMHYQGFVLSDILNNPNLVVLPHYRVKDRPALNEASETRWIDCGNEADFNSIFTKLAASNGSLSQSDKDILAWFVGNRDIEPLLPEKIPQKETLALLVSLVANKDCFVDQIKTATDVLRIAVGLSGGDVSLAEPAKFRNFTKPERRFLLTCLERSGSSRTEDMLRWKDRWIRLGERLHPGDFKTRFPESLASFDVVRNSLPFESFNSKVERLIRNKHPGQATKLLVQRPGELARRLDHLLRTSSDHQSVLESFRSVAEKVSTPVLLQAWGHFVRRNAPYRCFFPKGNAAKVQFSNEPLARLPQEIIEAAAHGLRETLVKRFAKLPPLGKCYIDKRLQHQIVPFSQRSASRSLRTVARGSSFELPPGDTLRFFCWWHNLTGVNDYRGRVDIDLSASLFNGDWEHCEDIAYYNLRGLDCYHSGDITSAPHGACEFIDIGLKSVVRKARYIVMSIFSFTGHQFTDLPECFGGWMMRQNPNSGEIFEARTVVDKVDLVATSRVNVPVIIDALERRVYWSDIALKSGSQINNAASKSVGFTEIGRSIVELNKPTLFELFAMHIEARGEFVESPALAETVFGLNEGSITAFDTSVILSDYLS